MVQGGVLGLHLVPYAGYGLGTSLDCELEPGLLQLCLDRADERLDVSLACALGLVELAGDVIIDVTVLIFDHHILHFALDGVQTQTVGHGDIEQTALLGYMQTVVIIVGARQHLHQHIAVGNKAYDYADILGKGYQKFAEVLIGYGIMLGIEVFDAAHALDELGCILTELLLELFRSDESLLYHRVEQSRKQRCFLEPRLLDYDYTGAYASVKHRNSVSISLVGAFGNTFAEQTFQPVPILSLKQRSRNRHQLPV